MYFIVSLRVYVCDYDRASVSGLLRPFLSFGFYPLNLHSTWNLPNYVCFVNVLVKYSMLGECYGECHLYLRVMYK